MCRYLKSLFCLCFILISCKPKIRQLETASYVVGPSNDIVNLDSQTAHTVPEIATKASVLLATWQKSGKIKFCSGSVTEPRTEGGLARILTNHHCFAAVDEEGHASAELITEACDNTKVIFEFSDLNQEAPENLDCLKGSLNTNHRMDLAVFRVSGELPEGVQPLKLWDREEFPQERDAYIVHYPDIAENYRALPGSTSIKLPKASVTTEDCIVNGPFAEDEWHLDQALPTSLRHTCDLIHGSSGSALIDRETNMILGINWGGVKISTFGKIRTDNVATAAKYVKAFLAETAGEIPESIEPARSSGLTEPEEMGVSEEAKTISKDVARNIVNKTCAVLLNAEGYDRALHSIWLLLVLLFPILLSLPRAAKCRVSGRNTKE